MCKNITTLTEISSARYVSQCEHGTVHLLWDYIGIQINELNFRTLAQNMERTWTEKQMNPHQPITKIWLKVGQIVLHVEAFEFQEMLGMVQEAVKRMKPGIETHSWMHTQFGPLHSPHGQISIN